MLAILSESAPLFRHDGLPALLLGECLLTDVVSRFRYWNRGDSHAFGHADSCLESRVVHLLVERWIVTTLSVDIVSQEVVPIVYATDRGIDISFTIGVEGRLAKVCGEG